MQLLCKHAQWLSDMQMNRRSIKGIVLDYNPLDFSSNLVKFSSNSSSCPSFRLCLLHTNVGVRAQSWPCKWEQLCGTEPHSIPANQSISFDWPFRLKHQQPFTRIEDSAFSSMVHDLHSLLWHGTSNPPVEQIKTSVWEGRMFSLRHRHRSRARAVSAGGSAGKKYSALRGTTEGRNLITPWPSCGVLDKRIEMEQCHIHKHSYTYAHTYTPTHILFLSLSLSLMALSLTLSLSLACQL